MKTLVGLNTLNKARKFYPEILGFTPLNISQTWINDIIIVTDVHVTIT